MRNDRGKLHGLGVGYDVVRHHVERHPDGSEVLVIDEARLHSISVVSTNLPSDPIEAIIEAARTPGYSVHRDAAKRYTLIVDPGGACVTIHDRDIANRS